MMFIKPWKIENRRNRYTVYTSFFVAGYCFATIFCSWLPTALWLLVPWLVYIAVDTIIDIRKLDKIKRNMLLIDEEMVRTDRDHNDLSGLPPELQEDIQIAWANKVLRDKA